MEFPITREQLQNYSSYYESVAKKRHLEFIASDVYMGLQQAAMQKGNMRFSYSTQQHKLQYYSTINSNSLADYRYLSVEEVMEFLREKFIGCDIITDPLKSYILIDWS